MSRTLLTLLCTLLLCVHEKVDVAAEDVAADTVCTFLVTGSPPAQASTATNASDFTKVDIRCVGPTPMDLGIAPSLASHISSFTGECL